MENLIIFGEQGAFVNNAIATVDAGVKNEAVMTRLSWIGGI